MSVSWNQKVAKWMVAHQSDMETIYTELHAEAEISWQEVRTTAYIGHKLMETGLDVRLFQEHTGVVGVWDSGKQGRTIALRADMDALWQCVNDEMRANHSCGHDAHMTMVLSAIRCLKEIGYEPHTGKIMAIFQPAEEVAEGALALSHSGVLDDVDDLLGIHLRPQKEMAFGQASSAIYHGGVVCLKGIIRGRQAHAARPEDGVNVIDTFAVIVNAVNQLKSSFSNRGSCKVTKVQVPNTSSNIIPDHLEFMIDIRASTDDMLTNYINEVHKIVQEWGSMNGAIIEIEVVLKTVPAIPDHELEEIISEVIIDVLGKEGLSAPLVTPGAEDFHFYRHERHTLRSTMIGLGSGLAPGLHHPEMSFQLEALGKGAAIMALSVIKLLDRNVGMTDMERKSDSEH